MELVTITDNNVWLPSITGVLQAPVEMEEYFEEGRASCHMKKEDSFNMLNMMSATILTVHAIVSAVNTANNNNNNNNNNINNNNNNNANTNMIVVKVMNMNMNMVGRRSFQDDIDSTVDTHLSEFVLLMYYLKQFPRVLEKLLMCAMKRKLKPGRMVISS